VKWAYLNFWKLNREAVLAMMRGLIEVVPAPFTIIVVYGADRTAAYLFPTTSEWDDGKTRLEVLKATGFLKMGRPKPSGYIIFEKDYDDQDIRVDHDHSTDTVATIWRAWALKWENLTTPEMAPFLEYDPEWRRIIDSRTRFQPLGRTDPNSPDPPFPTWEDAMWWPRNEPEDPPYRRRFVKLRRLAHRVVRKLTRLYRKARRHLPGGGEERAPWGEEQVAA